MCNSALYHKNMDELQGDNNFFAIFNSLYLVSSDILLTHTHRRYRCNFLQKLPRIRARETRRTLFRQRTYIWFLRLDFCIPCEGLSFEISPTFLLGELHLDFIALRVIKVTVKNLMTHDNKVSVRQIGGTGAVTVPDKVQNKQNSLTNFTVAAGHSNSISYTVCKRKNMTFN